MAEKSYRIYVTDSLHYQGTDRYLKYRYKDQFDKKNVDTRSGDEIALDVMSRHGLRFKDECI